MADLSQQVVPDVVHAIAQEAPAHGFHKTAECTKDTRRVILGGACGGVKANNKDKLRY